MYSSGNEPDFSVDYIGVSRKGTLVATDQVRIKISSILQTEHVDVQPIIEKLPNNFANRLPSTYGEPLRLPKGLSETRFYMALLMGATMAMIMLGFMLGMYKNKKANIGIFATSTVVFFGTLWLVRSQETVQDVSWMKAMIPHHSIAILTSERAEISDPRVRELADEIIEAQRREIAEMKKLIADLEGEATTAIASR